MPKFSKDPVLRCDRPCDLLRDTLKLLETDKRPRERLALELGVPRSWLVKLEAGQIASPSVNRIRYIFKRLSK